MRKFNPKNWHVVVRGGSPVAAFPILGMAREWILEAEYRKNDQIYHSVLKVELPTISKRAYDWAERQRLHRAKKELEQIVPAQRIRKRHAKRKRGFTT